MSFPRPGARRESGFFLLMLVVVLSARAIVSLSKVALDRLGGRPLGDPVKLPVSRDGDSVYVINHHGSIDHGTFRQRGGRGQIAVLDLPGVLDPENDDTAPALAQSLDSGGFGAIGAAFVDDMIVVGNVENYLTEDGGNRVTFVDAR